MNHDASTVSQTRSPIPVRIFNGCGAALGKIGIKRGPLRAAELIETAKRRTGLDDFGGGEFFEPLSRLLESCHREAHLNLIGQMALKTDVVRTLCTRLLMKRDRRCDSQIAVQEIRAPLVIVGLPRSGTTLLHILLAADPAHRVPLTWEVMSPSPPNDSDREKRIRYAARNLSSLQWLAPTFQNVHALGAELPQECVSLMSPTFISDQFDTMYNIPTYRAWYLKQDPLPAYQYHRRFLQHLQRRKNGARWVLKAPAHMFSPRTLLSIYPDAHFVQTHRDPIEAISSVSSLVCILRGVFSDSVDPVQIGRDAVDYWVDALKNFISERDRLPAGRVCDLHYAEIRRDPIAAVRSIYEYFGWTLEPETEQRMRAVLASQPRNRSGSHRYHPSQFGLGDASPFNDYCERFGLDHKVDWPLRRAMPELAATPPELTSSSPSDEFVRLTDKGLLDPPTPSD